MLQVIANRQLPLAFFGGKRLGSEAALLDDTRNGRCFECDAPVIAEAALGGERPGMSAITQKEMNVLVEIAGRL